MSYKVLIIDDESRTRSLLFNILSQTELDLSLHQDGDSVESGLEAIKSINPDIVLLDIQLPDGSGFDILDQIGDRDFQVIFITAHVDYAVEAIKRSALDYILKPIDKKELKQAVERAIEQLSKNANQPKQYEALLSDLKGDRKKIVLRTAESLIIIDVDTIVRCNSEGNYTTFYLSDDRKIVTSKTLKEYEQSLSGTYFIRCHRSHIINLNFVDRLDRNDRGIIVMKDGTEIPLSRSFREKFLELLEKMA